jgi:HTH-type transcriptional regulator, glycine betaine synthesis regulator
MASVSRPSTPDTRLSAGEQAVISIFVDLAQAIGMQKSLGEIYGLLFATPQPLAFQDIVDRLGLSKGSVSQGLKFLRTVGAIKPVEVPGDRREYVEPVVELRALVGGFLRERLNPELENWGVRAKALKVPDFQTSDSDAMQGQSVAARNQKTPRPKLTVKNDKIIQDRIEKLRTWQKRANTVLPMVSKLLG